MTRRELLDRAVEFSVLNHRGQYRKSLGIPYVSHVLDVMKRLAQYGVTDEEWLAAAVLHDVVEDTEATSEEIANLFGKRVAAIVDYVTWPRQMNKQEKWNYLAAKVGDNNPVSMEGTILKIADRISNVEDYRSVPDTHGYASKYALEGFPVFFLFVTQFSQDWESIGLKAESSLKADLFDVDRIIQERYSKFRLLALSGETTTLAEAAAMRFGHKPR